VTLFPASDLKPKLRRAGRDRRARRRIPTGAPRLVESAGDRLERASIETWQGLISAIQRSATSRLELWRGRAGGDRVPCPWERLTCCGVSCRCCGAGTVTIDFLRDHCAHLATEIAMFVRPARPAPLRGRPS